MSCGDNGLFNTKNRLYTGPNIVEFFPVNGFTKDEPGVGSLTVKPKINFISKHGLAQKDLKVPFVVDDSSTAVAGIDYKIVTPSPAEIAKGKTSTHIKIKIMAHELSKGDVRILYLSLKGSDNFKPSFNYGTIRIIIRGTNKGSTQATKITQQSLDQIASASSTGQVANAVQTFLSQYDVNFSTNCPSIYYTTCNSLSGSDLTNMRLLATEFVQEWSKYPVKWVHASKPNKVFFVKNLKVQGSPVAAEPYLYAPGPYMLYDIGDAGNPNDVSSQQYMRETIHLQYEYLIQYIHFGTYGSPDSEWKSLNPSGFEYGSGAPAGQHTVEGFVNGYATRSMVLDKAYTYTYLFETADHTKLLKWIKTDEYLAEKVANYKAFIQSIVPGMNDSYFKEIADYYKKNHNE